MKDPQKKTSKRAIHVKILILLLSSCVYGQIKRDMKDEKDKKLKIHDKFFLLVITAHAGQ